MADVGPVALEQIDKVVGPVATVAIGPTRLYESSQRPNTMNLTGEQQHKGELNQPDAQGDSVAEFVRNAAAQIERSLDDLTQLTVALRHENTEETVCAMLHCPRHQALSEAIADAIIVLEETKHAFKSPQLHALRRRLETVLIDDAER
jgi:hypothetical protein